MIFSVADIMGLNPITKKILSNAEGAVCGMAESRVMIVIEKPLEERSAAFKDVHFPKR